MKRLKDWLELSCKDIPSDQASLPLLELSRQQLQRAFDAGRQRGWGKLLLITCRILGKLRMWDAPEWDQLDAYARNLVPASHNLFNWCQYLLAKRALHTGNASQALAGAEAVYHDVSVDTCLRLKCGTVMAQSLYGHDTTPEQAALMDDLLDLAKSNKSCPFALEAAASVLLDCLFRSLAKDGWPSPAHPFPMTRPQDGLPVVLGESQQWMSIFQDMYLANPNGEREGYAPWFFLSSMLAIQSGRDAAALTLGRAKVTQTGINLHYVEAAEIMCDVLTGNMEGARRALGPWSTSKIQTLGEWPLCLFLSFMQYRVHLASHHIREAQEHLTLYMHLRDRHFSRFMGQVGPPRPNTSSTPAAPFAAPSVVLTVAPAPTVTQKALRFIEDNLSDTISVSELAQRLGVSRRTLEKAFKDEINQTIMESVKIMRLYKAKEMLQQSDVDLSLIRQYVGYSSASAFSRDFRAFFGQPPTNFRTQVSPRR